MERGEKDYVMFSKGGQFLPQEEMLEVRKRKNHLILGIPRETAFQENRVALAPEAVSLLVQNGHKVLIESKAGENAFFPDNEYSEVGGEIVYSSEEVFKANIILKVSPLTDQEMTYLRTGQVIFSALAMPMQKESYFKTLANKKVTAAAFELIRDKTNSFPLVRSMSEIAGNTSILIAAEYLSDRKFGKGRMFGGFSGITPTEVVILGAGTVGEYAVRAAMGLGAMVKVFDNSLYKLRRLQNNLSARIFTSIIQPKVLLKALKTADVVIGALHAPWGRTPIVVNEEMVSQMKYGSVIVDVSIDQGGCIETSEITNHSDPVFRKFGVTHYCVPNIASRVPHTASYAFSNFFGPVLLKLGEAGGLENMLKHDPGVRQGVYLFNGILTNQYIGEYFHLPYQDIDLLMAAFK
ncbi:MAG: alanine dehydrogenase [Bacteroides sp.]|jgi:alanine dehydrogenase|nr:alanine dehydrogenase [Bacteroides sp.]